MPNMEGSQRNMGEGDMKEQGFRERRQHNRARILMEAVFQGDDPDNLVRLKIDNFSVGGFACSINRRIEPMTRLGITFEFPPYAEHPPRTLETTAVVVRCEEPVQPATEYRLGACFIEISREARDHIQGYVDWFDLVYGSQAHEEERDG